ncbi:MAG: hypothetical protein LBG42_06715 [Treponema sp.]|nr:hypothetical protein [Treponema sp.]
MTRVLDKPFFTLEYAEGIFIRKLPKGVRDLGGGLFREGNTVWSLPCAPENGEKDGHPLAGEIIRGRALLSLLRGGDYVLAVSGPVPAEKEDRLTELALVPGPAGISPGAGELRMGRGVPVPPVYMEIRTDGDPDLWLPLTDLPRHRYRQGVVYEIMDDETMDGLLADWGAVPAGNAGNARTRGGKNVRGRLVLRGENIPRFCDARGDLVRRFGDGKLRDFLSEESVFIPPFSLSFVYTAEPGSPGSARAFPSLKYGGRRYPAGEVSALMEREYALLDDKWARRGDLEKAGLLPLGHYAGGIPLGAFTPGAADIIFREGNGPAGFLPFEWKTELWNEGPKEKGGSGASKIREIFGDHVRFLRSFGLSGGAVIPRRREQAECLASLAEDLASKTETALILVERTCYELYFGGMPEFKNAAPFVSTAFYDELAENAPPHSYDLLVLVEPEEAGTPGVSGGISLAAVNAPVVLGIFSDPFEASSTGKGNRNRLRSGIRDILGIRDERLDKYLVRRLNVPLPLPEGDAREIPAEEAGARRVLLRPPRPLGERTILFLDRVKFRKLPAADLLSELSRINEAGEKSPYVPLRSPRRDPAFDSLNEDEARYFFYWRGEFRRLRGSGGPMPAADEDYLRLYARELILAMGGDSAAAFQELLALWTEYRGVFPGTDGYFPAWLLDFAALYEIGDAALPLLLPLVPAINPEGEGVPDILADLHIHCRFIDGNNTVRFEDIRPLIPPAGKDGGETESGEELARVLNIVDRFLRENFRLRLFEFFYPPASRRETRDAFGGLGGAGSSSYTAEWISFSRHRPLLEFLETLKNHLEFHLNIRAGVNRKPLAEPWKSIIAGALDHVPPVREISISRQTVQPERLERLRRESDKVRELLAPPPPAGTAPPAAEPPPLLPPAGPRRRPSSLPDFLSTLSETERAALSILRGANRADFGAFARRNGVMPDLVIDGINARFEDLFGDLLINVMDEGPEIQAEYREELDRLFDGN